MTYYSNALRVRNVCYASSDHKHSPHSYLQRLIIGDSPGDVSEEPVTSEKPKKGWKMSCDVGEAMEVLENEL